MSSIRGSDETGRAALKPIGWGIALSTLFNSSISRLIVLLDVNENIIEESYEDFNAPCLRLMIAPGVYLRIPESRIFNRIFMTFL